MDIMRCLTRGVPTSILLAPVSYHGRRAKSHPHQLLPAKRTGRSSAIASSIGFNLPGSEPAGLSPERQAEELTKAAASLLLYQSVVQGKQAQSFLQVLAQLQKGSSVRLLEAYGDLYKGLAAARFGTWQDYLLAQVLKGLDKRYLPPEEWRPEAERRRGRRLAGLMRPKEDKAAAGGR